MRYLLFLLLLTGLAWAAPEDDLVKHLLDTHANLKSGQIDVSVNVTADWVPFKGLQQTSLIVQRPNDLLWKSHADMKDMQLDVQVTADGKEVVLYNSGEGATGEKNVYYRRPFSDDVVTLANNVNLGVQTLILRMMSGNRETFLAGRTLRVPNPAVQNGLYMLELVSSDGDVDQVWIDSTTFYVKRLTALAKREESSPSAEPVAEATVTYARIGQAFEPALFRFVPPPGAKAGVAPPSGPPPAEKR